MTGSYRTDCESCEESISAAYRFCPWCGTEQQRAVEAIRRMRNDTDEMLLEEASTRIERKRDLPEMEPIFSTERKKPGIPSSDRTDNAGEVD